MLDVWWRIRKDTPDRVRLEGIFCMGEVRARAINHTRFPFLFRDNSV